MRSVMLMLMLSGCGGAPRIVQYAPLPDTRERVPLIVPAPSSGGSHPWQRDAMDVVDHDVLPTPDAAKGAGEKDPHALVRDANSDALNDPSDCEMEGHTLICSYSPTNEYEIYACGARNVVLELAPGEHLTKRPMIGDQRRWKFDTATSGDGRGHTIDLVLFRPDSESSKSQQAQVLTNIGPYFIQLNVLAADEKACMRAVRWDHPELELQRLMQDENKKDEVKRSASADGCVSANYEIEAIEGSPMWVPTIVWRTCDGDHAKVHIQFRADVAWSQIPALKSDGGVVDYRYIPEDHVIVVDGLFTRGVLSLGSEQTGYERVAIRALKDPR